MKFISSAIAAVTTLLRAVFSPEHPLHLGGQTGGGGGGGASKTKYPNGISQAATSRAPEA